MPQVRNFSLIVFSSSPLCLKQHITKFIWFLLNNDPSSQGPGALLSHFQNDCHSFLTHLPHHPVWPTPNRFGYFCLSHLPKMLLNIQSPYLKAIDWPSNTHRVKFQQTNCVKYKALHKTEPILLSPSFVLSPLHKHKVPNYSLSIPNTLLRPNSVPFYMQVSPWHEQFFLHNLVSFHSIY